MSDAPVLPALDAAAEAAKVLILDEAAETAKVPKPSGVELSSLGVAVGERVEVLWEVEMTDGSDESVWWSATVAADDESGEPGSARLTYVPQHGFDEEVRRVLFVEGSYLWDAALRERLPYRREGEAGPPLIDDAPGTLEADGEEADDDDEGEGTPTTQAPDGALAVGTSVKARFQNGERFCAGTIHAAHADGTYDVLYEDHVIEEHVPRDVIEVVEIDATVAAELNAAGTEPPAASSTNEFFETFVASLTAGPAFARLSAEQQAFASDKVRAMRPHFEAELESLKERRGWGAVVTGADIKEMLPRVMARAKGA